MAMQFHFNIQPFGDRHNEFAFGGMRVVSAGHAHVYTVTYKNQGQWHIIRGEVPKDKSGHRNFLHLLRDILADMDLDELGSDYVDIFNEMSEMYPHLNLKRTRDYAS